MPFFKTSGVPLRTQICDFPGQSGSLPWRGLPLICQYAGSLPFVPRRFGSPALGRPACPLCGKLSISHRLSPHPLIPLSGNLFTTLDTVTEPVQSATSRTFKLTLAYDGTGFSGWQIQPGQLTIQGQLQAALGRITGEAPLPQGSGRTDAGVHALAQVASFTLQAPIPPENLLRALNRTLPAAIRILDARTVRSTFHARHSAVAKTYEYRISRERICPPFLARYVHACIWPLDPEVLDRAAADLIGEHDFFSFAATDPDHSSEVLLQEPRNSLRTIYSSAWEHQRTEAGQLLVYRVRGNGFLHHMVRNLAGTMLEIGRGQFPPDSIPRILAARNRSAAGPTAPARGLFLHSVEYGPQADDPPLGS